jgi:hypothetical protein
MSCSLSGGHRVVRDPVQDIGGRAQELEQECSESTAASAAIARPIPLPKIMHAVLPLNGDLGRLDAHTSRA